MTATPPDFNAEQFWQDALEFYSSTGKKELLLTLQDEYGLNVNCLLFCVYLARQHGLVVSVNAAFCLEKALADFHQPVTQEIRNLRRWVKDAQKSALSASGIYQHLLNIELICEKIEQKLLVRSAYRFFWSESPSSVNPLFESLQNYARTCSNERYGIKLRQIISQLAST